MKKKNEWHYNKDYRDNDTFTGLFVVLAFVVSIICLIISINNKRFDKYNWDVEEYPIMDGDTVDAVIKEYHDTWCVGTGVTFETYRDKVYDWNKHIEDINMVHPGDKIKLPINPTKR